MCVPPLRPRAASLARASTGLSGWNTPRVGCAPGPRRGGDPLAWNPGPSRRSRDAHVGGGGRPNRGGAPRAGPVSGRGHSGAPPQRRPAHAGRDLSVRDGECGERSHDMSAHPPPLAGDEKFFQDKRGIQIFENKNKKFIKN